MDRALPAALACLAGLAALAAVAAPAAAQGPGAPSDPPELPRTTTLYLHANGFQPMPITSVPPPDWHRGDGESYGLATSTVSCLPAVPGSSLTSQEHHTLYGYGLRGHVDYSGERPRYDGDGYGAAPGGFDVPLLGDRMTLHWYWETTEPAGATPPQPVPIPGVVVEATLRTGPAPFTAEFGGEAFDEGQVIAHGRTEPALLAGADSSGVAHERVDGRDVYHFEVPLSIEAPVLPADGYGLRIDTYVARDGCPGGGYAMPNAVAPHTSVGHRPRLEFAAEDDPSVEVVYAGLGLNGTPGRIVVHANATSPWGKHEVRSIELAISGPGAASYVWRMPETPTFHCHCPPTPAQATWIWDADADGAAPGTYLATVTVATAQGKWAVAQREFTVEGDRDAPGTGAPLLLLGLLAAAGMALRRR